MPYNTAMYDTFSSTNFTSSSRHSNKKYKDQIKSHWMYKSNKHRDKSWQI